MQQVLTAAKTAELPFTQPVKIMVSPSCRRINIHRPCSR
jgi:hypothetical protein